MAVKKDPKTNKWYYYGSIYDNGKVIKQYKKRGFLTKREAMNGETDFLREYHERVIYKNPLFDDLVKEYLEKLRTQVKTSSYIADESIYRKTPEWVKEDYQNVETLQEYINVCDKKFSKRHVEKIYYCFNKLLRYGVQQNLIKENPMPRVTRDSRKNEKEKEIQFWEKADFDKFIKEINDPIYHACFMTLYYMGLRKGEMQALTWNDINFKDKKMTINKIVSHKYNKGESPITTPKTKNSYRTITIPDILLKELKNLYDIERQFSSFSNDSFVFGVSKWIPSESLRRTLKKGILSANVPYMTIHGFRHSHASYLINNMGKNDYSDYDIAQRLGDTVETLHRVYAHWFIKKDKEIIDFMNKAEG